MKKFEKILIWSFLGIIIFAWTVCFVPFIGFGGSYDKVCADAAAAYGLDANDYDIRFQKKIKNSYGEPVQGLYRVEKDKEIIIIQNMWSRPMMVATIFHEFAHAAQHAHKLDFGGHSCEQHAEILSFSKMWQSDYKWNGVHLLYLHLVGKSGEYRATSTLWHIAFTNETVA